MGHIFRIALGLTFGLMLSTCFPALPDPTEDTFLCAGQDDCVNQDGDNFLCYPVFANLGLAEQIGAAGICVQYDKQRGCSHAEDCHGMARSFCATNENNDWV